MSRSHRANHYGTLAEREGFERWNLEAARASWKDAEDKKGRPWELKATMLEHADGQPGNFKLYSQYHRKLRRYDGYYGFQVYRVQGRGIRVVKAKAMHSSQLPRLSWHGGGDHRDAKQAKLGIAEVFG